MELVGYALVTGAGLLSLFLVTVAGAGIAAALRRTASPFLHLPRIAFLFGLVFLVGAFADVAWVLLLDDRWYIEVDPIVAFSPVFPFTLDTVCGSHFISPGSWFTLELMWAAFALTTWLVSVRLLQSLGSESAV